MKGDDQKPYLKFNVEDLTKELKENKELIKMTSGKEDGEEESSGSDSEPSEDNLDAEEMSKIIPMKAPPKKKQTPLKKNSVKDRQKKLEEEKEAALKAKNAELLK
jgi:hypothetical protein